MLALGRGVAADADSLLAVRQANFDRFAEANPEERVYLHFDNTSYYKGERIWYKAYVVRGSDFIATPLSRILYVELLNPMGYPVETQKLAINNGQADGSFYRPDRVVETPDEVVVIDYKFGAVERSSYKKQVRTYMQLIGEMGYARVSGFIWYLSLGKIEAVE